MEKLRDIVIKVGDVVRRIDRAAPPGTLYVVTYVPEAAETYNTYSGYTYSHHGAKFGKCVKAIPVFIAFDSRPKTNRREIELFDFELKILDITDIATEYNRLGMFIASEAKRRSEDGNEGPP